MVTSAPPASPPHPLARQLRERFARAVEAMIDPLGAAIDGQLDGALRGGSRLSMAELSVAMEAAGAFKRVRAAWLDAAHRQWAAAGAARAATATSGARPGGKPSLDFDLVDDDVVEGKIIASRLGAAVVEGAGSEWNDLRLRMKRLERGEDLASDDPLRPEVLVQALLKAWTDQGLTRPMWALVHAAVQTALAPRYKDAYTQANAFLQQQGIAAELELRQRRPAGAGSGPAGAPGRPPAASNTAAGHGAADAAGPATGSSGWGVQPGTYGGAPMSGGGAAPRAPSGGVGRGPAAGTGRYARPGGERWVGGRSEGASLAPAGDGVESGAGGATTGWRAGVRPSALVRAAQETRLVTGLSPMARVRQRAQGVLGQIRRLLSDHVADYDSGVAPQPPSPPLAQALAEPDPAFAATEWIGRGSDTAPVGVSDVRVVAQQLRQRATELKAKAERPSEKAVIEIVALMFQAILAEERIAPGIRVWFARLQIPVLRLALAEPDFFASVEHPARQLIDRMGACALGFDAATVTDERLEREVKRIVQVIEQYPETGRRVYQLMLDEFKKFLGSSLVEAGGVQQAATLAQQVEQKEALAVQYTIELRRMLASLPVSDEVRDFLFRIWSDVLAIAAVRQGAQHADTLRLKQAAADLLWAVSAKPDRAERSRVVQQLPRLLHSLREGMGLLALPAEEQDRQIKIVNDAVMQAFMAREEGLTPAQLEQLAGALAALEDVVTDDPEGDLWLDPAVIEMVFGASAAAVEVVAEGGSQPPEAIVQWARALDLGTGFTLDYRGAAIAVQYAWRSARGQLHLLASRAGKSYLLQTQRLAAYLQAGLLVPLEDEALTVRATRDALAKLQVQPGQMLQ
ncbi:MAG TPA: DUF1631 family protein [Ottowia sp.]|nr:DUF1631 family protein [Ottowia sp.]